jgi:hypothetical protein
VGKGWSYNANVPCIGANYQVGVAGSTGPHTIGFVQNDADLIAATGEAAWLLDASQVTITLPPHFTFDGLPGVEAIDVADLQLGPPTLADARTLVIPVVSNARGDVFNGINITDVFLHYDGVALPDFYWPQLLSTVDITPVTQPFNPTATIDAEGYYRGMAVYAAPQVDWFDETLGGVGFPTFADLAAAHAAWMGAPDHVVDFEGHPNGTKITDQYDPLGIWFSGTDGGAFNQLTGVQVEGDPDLVQNLTGYDGSYQPDGSGVYVRFDNTPSNPDAPVTYTFGELQRCVGAFIACGVEGDDHSFTLTVYGDDDEVLGTRVYSAELWETDPTGENYETFFGVRTSVPEIRAVSVSNNATVQFADALILDSVAWETGPGTPFGDRDRDADVDVPDFEALELVLNGPSLGAGFPVPGFDDRYAFDGDSDADIDLVDFAGFAVAFTGEITQLPPPRALGGAPGGSSGEVELAWQTPQFNYPSDTATEPAYDFRMSSSFITPATWDLASPIAGDLPPVGVNGGYGVNLHVDAQCEMEGNYIKLDTVYMRAWLTVQVHIGNLIPYGYPIRNETIVFSVYDQNDNLVATGSGVTDYTGMADFDAGDVNDSHDCSQPNWPMYSFEAYWAGHTIGLSNGLIITSGDKTDTEDMMTCDGDTYVPPAGTWSQFGGLYTHMLGDVAVEIYVPAYATFGVDPAVQVYEPTITPPPTGLPPTVPGPIVVFTVEKLGDPFLEKPAVFTVDYPAYRLDEFGGVGESSLRAYRFDEQTLTWMPVESGPVVIDRDNHVMRFASSVLGTFGLAAEIDVDHDGLGEEEELLAGLLPGIADSDGDGLLDGDEVWFTLSDPLDWRKIGPADQLGLATGLPPGTGVFISGRIICDEYESPLSNCVYLEVPGP